MHRSLAIALVSSFALQGCANTPPSQYVSTVQSVLSGPTAAGCKPVATRSNVDNAVLGGAVGAAGAAAIAAANGAGSRGIRNSAVGGGLVGALAGYHFGNSIGVSEQADGSVKLDIAGVLFDTGKVDIKSDFNAPLDKIAASMREYCISARIVGHTDNVGSATSNMALSIRRAGAVEAYLEARQVPAERLSSIGRGQLEPVDPSNTEAARAKNRRVEIVMRPAGS